MALFDRVAKIEKRAKQFVNIDKYRGIAKIISDEYGEVNLHAPFGKVLLVWVFTILGTLFSRYVLQNQIKYMLIAILMVGLLSIVAIYNIKSKLFRKMLFVCIISFVVSMSVSFWVISQHV